MKNLLKTVKSTIGKVLLSSFLLVCILATKGVHSNNVQALSLSQDQVQTTGTIQSDHIDRQRHIIPTLPEIKSNERIQFMNCKYVEYDKNINTYNLVLTDTNNQTDGEWVIPLFKFNYNKQLLQELHNFFYNQISIVTLNNNNTKDNIEDDTIVDFQLLDEQFTGEQLSNDAVADEINEIVSKHNIK